MMGGMASRLAGASPSLFAGVAEWISVKVFCLLVSGSLFSVCGFSVSAVRVGRAGRIREL